MKRILECHTAEEAFTLCVAMVAFRRKKLAQDMKRTALNGSNAHKLVCWYAGVQLLAQLENDLAEVSKRVQSLPNVPK